MGQAARKDCTRMNEVTHKDHARRGLSHSHRKVVDALHHSVEKGYNQDDERVHLKVAENGNDVGLDAHGDEKEEVDHGDADSVLHVFSGVAEDED